VKGDEKYRDYAEYAKKYHNILNIFIQLI